MEALDILVGSNGTTIGARIVDKWSCKGRNN